MMEQTKIGILKDGLISNQEEKVYKMLIIKETTIDNSSIKHHKNNLERMMKKLKEYQKNFYFLLYKLKFYFDFLVWSKNYQLKF